VGVPALWSDSGKLFGDVDQSPTLVIDELLTRNRRSITERAPLINKALTERESICIAQILSKPCWHEREHA